MILRGDCLEVLLTLEDNSVDAVVTDPPYGIGFMGHEWDQPGVRMPDQREGVPPGQRRVANPPPSGHGREGAAMEAGRYDLSRSANRAFQAWCEQWAREALRVLKPGGHIAAFGGARTSHRLACAIEDAGFEMRDSILWLFGQGFPKSLDVSKAIDKAAGAEREVVGMSSHASGIADGNAGPQSRDTDFAWAQGKAVAAHYPITAPATPEAKRWQGWGTALKPAHEPIVLGRKPLDAGGVAANVLRHGTGAINIDGARIAGADENPAIKRRQGATTHLANGRKAAETEADGRLVPRQSPEAYAEPRPGELLGRWPANVVLTHTEDCVLLGDRRVKGITGTSGQGGWGGSEVYGWGPDQERGVPLGYADEDGLETVQAWECVEGCPIRALDEQSGSVGAQGRASGPSLADPYEKGRAFGARLGTDRPAPYYADDGGASRFFMTTARHNLEGCEPALTAEQISSLADKPHGSVPSDAQPYPVPPSCDRSDCQEPSTSGTPTPSGDSAGSGTPPTPSFGSALSHARLPDEPSLSDNPVSDAEIQKRIGITTTTTNPSSSDGSAADAMSGVTLPSEEAGVVGFRYCGKASRIERNAGLEGFEEREILSGDENPGSFQSDGTDRAQKNFHPTVKPLDLMRWLVRLVTPPGGTVLDLFMGSGTTGCACALEGMEFIGVERDIDKDGNPMGYIRIAEARIKFWSEKPVGIDTRKVLRAELAKPERTGQLSIL